jgi:hypothetical protein
MLDASLSMILKELWEEMPRHGKVSTYFLIFLMIEVWPYVQGGGLDLSMSKSGYIVL